MTACRFRRILRKSRPLLSRVEWRSRFICDKDPASPVLVETVIPDFIFGLYSFVVYSRPVPHVGNDLELEFVRDVQAELSGRRIAGKLLSGAGTGALEANDSLQRIKPERSTEKRGHCGNQPAQQQLQPTQTP